MAAAISGDPPPPGTPQPRPTPPPASSLSPTLSPSQKQQKRQQRRCLPDEKAAGKYGRHHHYRPSLSIHCSLILSPLYLARRTHQKEKEPQKQRQPLNHRRPPLFPAKDSPEFNHDDPSRQTSSIRPIGVRPSDRRPPPKPRTAGEAPAKLHLRRGRRRTRPVPFSSPFLAILGVGDDFVDATISRTCLDICWRELENLRSPLRLGRWHRVECHLVWTSRLFQAIMSQERFELLDFFPGRKEVVYW